MIFTKFQTHTALGFEGQIGVVKIEASDFPIYPQGADLARITVRANCYGQGLDGDTGIIGSQDCSRSVGDIVGNCPVGLEIPVHLPSDNYGSGACFTNPATYTLGVEYNDSSWGGVFVASDKTFLIRDYQTLLNVAPTTFTTDTGFYLTEHLPSIFGVVALVVGLGLIIRHARKIIR